MEYTAYQLMHAAEVHFWPIYLASKTVAFLKDCNFRHIFHVFIFKAIYLTAKNNIKGERHDLL